MALMNISVIPLGTPTTSLGDYIVKIIKILDEEGATYKLTDMGTIVEGKAHRLFEIANRLHEFPFSEGVKRVITTIEIDDRRDKKVELGDKVKSVQARLK